ncbi:MAG TPA: phosphate signaling complex protein PhoU [Rhodothermales bacterium]|nr:phosphate signaling complex protein PhoU [Rhodothermales bacterium]
MPVHRHLDDELLRLRNLLIEMSNLVDEQLADAINAVTSGDLDLADAVRRRDDEVDAMELMIDHQCERILALFTPVAMDLRLLIMAVKINSDLERIGDHAKNLAKNARHLAGFDEVLRKTPMLEMADVARSILHDVQDAFIKRDRLLARKVLPKDKQVDKLHKETLRALVELIRKNPDNAEAAVYLISMSRGIERIADHAKNIAEGVVFLVDGVDIRHRKLREQEDQTERLS